MSLERVCACGRLVLLSRSELGLKFNLACDTFGWSVRVLVLGCVCRSCGGFLSPAGIFPFALRFYPSGGKACA